jgi:hypothetical protein
MSIRSTTNIMASLFFLVGLLGGCQSSAALPPSSDKAVPVSLLVSINAQVEIKREGWKDYVPVGFGTLVSPTDLLKPAGEVSILCADLKTIKVLDSAGRNPCPLPKNDQLTEDDMLLIGGSRGLIPSDIPYILYPRNTTILEERPFLRWKDTGGKSYTVAIQRGAQTIWQQMNVTGDQLRYPNDADPLRDGIDYLLVVTDNSTGRTSTEDPNPGLGFQVVSASQREEIGKRQREITQIAGLDPSAQKLAIALYDTQLRIGGRGLWGEGTDLLKEVAQSQPGVPAVYMLLGKSLDRTKLPDEEQWAYQMALETASSINDLESMADALGKLWLLTNDQTNFDQAVKLYEQIGATEKAEQLRGVLKP